MNQNEKLNLQIAKLRKAKGITQSELANALGITFQSVSKWENGIAYPDITLLPQISRYFNVSVDYLLGLDPRCNIEKQYFIAADQGGTKTLVMLCNIDGTIIGQAKTEGACWFYAGIDKAIGYLTEGINILKSQAGISSDQIAFIVCGAAGINWDDECGMYTQAVEQKTHIKAYIYNDCAAAVYCDGLEYQNRIALCAGTEFDAAVITPELKTPFVYCNHTLPQDMGGSEIGNRAINAVLRAEEKLASETSLTEKVLHYFDLQDVDELLRGYRRRLLEKHPKGLTPIVFEMARQGDRVSADILCDIANNMSVYACGAIRKYRLQATPVAIILAGGVFKNEFPPFYEAIEQNIRAICPGAVIIRTTKEPVDGAYNIGLMKAKKFEGV